ncbi:MAG: hypothetical protein C0631_04125, partial [Sedimenticola sp.]
AAQDEEKTKERRRIGPAGINQRNSNNKVFRVEQVGWSRGFLNSPTRDEVVDRIQFKEHNCFKGLKKKDMTGFLKCVLVKNICGGPGIYTVVGRHPRILEWRVPLMDQVGRDDSRHPARRPYKKAFIEHFNRTYRNERFDLHLVRNLAEARKVIGYNEQRSHDSRGGLTPAGYISKYAETLLINCLLEGKLTSQLYADVLGSSA